MLSREKKKLFSPIYLDESLLMFVVAVLTIGFAFVWKCAIIIIMCYCADRPPEMNDFFYDWERSLFALYGCVHFGVCVSHVFYTKLNLQCVHSSNNNYYYLLCVANMRKKNRQTISRKLAKVTWLALCKYVATNYYTHFTWVCARHTRAACMCVSLTLCVCISVALHEIWVKHLWNKNTHTTKTKNRRRNSDKKCVSVRACVRAH